MGWGLIIGGSTIISRLSKLDRKVKSFLGLVILLQPPKFFVEQTFIEYHFQLSVKLSHYIPEYIFSLHFIPS